MWPPLHSYSGAVPTSGSAFKDQSLASSHSPGWRPSVGLAGAAEAADRNPSSCCGAELPGHCGKLIFKQITLTETVCGKQGHLCTSP